MKTLQSIFILLACFTFAAAQAKRFPTVDQIIDNYIEAIGGRTALLNIKSQHSTGSVKMLGVDHDGTYETYVKAPNKLLIIMRLNIGEIRVGFDGSQSWTQAPGQPAAYDPPERRLGMKRDADFYQMLQFNDRFRKAKVTGIQKVEEEDTYVIEAFPVGEKDPQLFYFSVASGFMTRRDLRTLDGQGKKVPTTVYLGDYREVDGVKCPSVTRTIQGNLFFETRELVLKNNVPIPDSMFKLPAVKR